MSLRGIRFVAGVRTSFFCVAEEGPNMDRSHGLFPPFGSRDECRCENICAQVFENLFAVVLGLHLGME